MPDSRPFELVVFGATGYTGRLVARYLAAAPSAAGLRWALAGRDAGKLAMVRAELAAEHPGVAGLATLPLLVADAADRAALDRVAAQARVVCTTVGPYARYGSALVAACAAAGTHYADITGEPHWIRRMIDAHHDEAVASGARLVTCCGFDSIPSDLGVWMLHDECARRGLRLARVEAFFGESRGRVGGGTIASMFGAIDAARADPDARRVMLDPYGLDPRPRVGGPDGRDPTSIRWEPRLRAWTAPWVMAAINGKIVRRSNALGGYPYGRDFRYAEVMSLPGTARGLAMAAGAAAVLGGVVVASQTPPLRAALERRLPKPGEGPTAAQRAKGYYVVRALAEAAAPGGAVVRLRGHVEDHRDPGFDSTAMMLAESALCLARDPLASPGGVLTPASAMGAHLLARLRAAGMTLRLEEG